MRRQVSGFFKIFRSKNKRKGTPLSNLQILLKYETVSNSNTAFPPKKFQIVFLININTCNGTVTTSE